MAQAAPDPDFVQDPGYLSSLVKSATFVGKGHVVVEKYTPGPKEIPNEVGTASGKIVIDEVVFPEKWQLPAAIPFERTLYYTYFASDPIWPSEMSVQNMNDLKVIAFAAGKPDALELRALVFWDNRLRNALEDIRAVFKGEVPPVPAITEDFLANHPVMAAHVCDPIFYGPGNEPQKMNLAALFFKSGSEDQKIWMFRSILRLIKHVPENGTSIGTQSKLLDLALKDMTASEGKALGAKVTDIRNHFEGIAGNGSFRKRTLAALQEAREKLPKKAVNQKERIGIGLLEREIDATIHELKSGR